MVKKILVFSIIILALLNVFQYYLIIKLQQAVLKQEENIRHDILSNLIEALEDLDRYNETKDEKYLGSVIVELRLVSTRTTIYSRSFRTDNRPVDLSVLSSLGRDLYSYNDHVESNINLDSLYKAIEYLLEHKDIIYNGSTEEFSQLVNQVETLIYN